MAEIGRNSGKETGTYIYIITKRLANKCTYVHSAVHYLQYVTTRCTERNVYLHLRIL